MDGSRAHPALVLDARVCASKSISGLHRRLNGSEYIILLGVGGNLLSETMFTPPPDRDNWREAGGNAPSWRVAAVVASVKGDKNVI